MIIPKIPNDLLSYISSGEAVAVIGSGFSVAAGFPSWNQLLELLINECEQNIQYFDENDELKHLLKKGYILEVAEGCRSILGKSLYNNLIQRVFRNPSINITDFHKFMFNIPFSSILTTNYDNLLEQTFYNMQKKECYLPVYTQKNIAQLARLAYDKDFYILKLHGDVNDIDSIVLTYKDYQDIIHSNPAYHKAMSAIFSTKSLIFFGYGLRDPDLMLLLEQYTTIFKGFNRTHFAFFPNAGKILSKSFLERYNIIVIPYNDRNRHQELKELLEYISGQSSLPYQKKPPEGKITLFSPLGVEPNELEDIDENEDPKIKKLRKDLRHLERQLMHAQKMESLGTLAGGIAHDFNNILSSLIGHAELCLSDAPEESKMHDNLKQILIAGERGREVIKQILSFSRYSVNEQKPLDIAIILKEATKLIRSTLPSTIEIKLDVQNDKFVVNGDPSQLHQIIMNLCTNAAHAMMEKGGVLELSLKKEELKPSEIKHIKGSKKGNYVCLSVRDTGCGIEEELISKIFDPFFTTKEKGKGTGLGLSVVYGIVNNYNGFINVETQLGKGTKFEIFLPALLEEDYEPSEPATDYKTEKLRILFIDDEKMLVSLGKQILERLGHNVTVFSDPVEALEIFRNSPEQYDLVISDMTMPKMTGDKFSIKLLQIRKNIPIILMTGFSDLIDEKEAGAIGIKTFLLKPFSMKSVSKAIKDTFTDD